MLPDSLRIPAFRRLLAASTLTSFGALMTFIALPMVAWQETGSGLTFAFVMAGSGIGMLIAMPFGGLIADRFDRRRMLLAGDACSILVTVAMLVAVEARLWWMLPIVQFAQTLLGSLFVSAAPALRRDVLTDDVRTQGTALHSAGMSTAQLIAPVAGGALYAAAGFTTVIVIDLAMYVMSLLLLLGMRLDASVTRPAGSQEAEDPGRAVPRAWSDIRSGLGVVWRDRFLRRFIGAESVGAFANGFLLVSAVPWIDVALGQPVEVWGTLLAITGGAGLAGSLLVARLGERLQTGHLIVAGSTAFLVGVLFLLGTPPLWRLYLAFALIGCTNVALSVAFGTSIQRRVAATHQGRVNGFVGCAFQAPQLAGTLLAGLAVESVGPAVAMQIAIGGFISSGLLQLRSAASIRAAAPGSDERDLVLGA